MPYIDKNKIDFRLPYLKDEEGDVLVSVRAVRNTINLTPVEDVVPRSELIKLFDEFCSRLNTVSGHPGLYTISEADLFEFKTMLEGSSNEKDS